MHPLAVPVTVKFVLDVGDTINGLVVEPVFQRYVVAPLAVNVAVCPLQIVGELTITVGNGFTVTIPLFVTLHPANVYVTEYVVVEPGLTEIVEVVCPPGVQEKLPPPADGVAVNIAEVPAHIV